MEEILVFQHDPLEDLGIFSQVLEAQRWIFRTIRLFQGEIPTEDWANVRALIILGGPMGGDEDRYPFLRLEKTLIRAALKEKIPMLGVSLGAQLIAAATGAEVYRGNFKEIGWFPVSLAPEGQLDSLLGYLPERPMVFQWHGEGFDLPQGALRLASSLYYDNQAFRIGRSCYGLQFHLEMTPAMIDRWVDEHWKELAGIPYVSPDKIRADTRSYSRELNYYGARFFSEFVRRLSTSKGRRKDAQQKNETESVGDR